MTYSIHEIKNTPGLKLKPGNMVIFDMPDDEKVLKSILDKDGLGMVHMSPKRVIIAMKI